MFASFFIQENISPLRRRWVPFLIEIDEENRFQRSFNFIGHEINVYAPRNEIETVNSRNSLERTWSGTKKCNVIRIARMRAFLSQSLREV